jgi:bifunctional oligoribonuclease and PAP phosphatase NrnA
MRAQIDRAERITLIAHVHSDADSLGSACAMYAHLLRLNKKVTLFCATIPIDSRLAFLPWSEKTTDRWDERADLAIAFDCGSPERLGVSPSCHLVNIDHHASNSGYGDTVMVDTDAISTTAILMRWFKTEGIKINAKMATALYAGLAEDTLGFMSRRCDASVHEMTAELFRLGADAAAANRSLFLQRPLSALRLKAMMLDSLRLLGNGEVAFLPVTRQMMEQSGADPQACEHALHEALGLPTVRVAFMLYERRDGSIKGSLRTDDAIDVGAIAGGFGGGGHRFASGFVMEKMPLPQASEQIFSIIKKELE